MLIPLIILLYFLLRHVQEYPRPEVHLDYATYKGLTLHHGVNQYLGMRFAASPVDDLRWRAPRDPPEEK
ncbi:carboxylesterase family protein, partial [Candidatus Bathyarchaeota archaeon]|nr:carboxylesterase family protein [Candidatus Bathyarchaeota archaeon]